MSTATTANASSVGATTISSMPLSMAQALLNQTATTLHTKIDRGQNLDPALATDGAGFTTPVTPC